MRLGKEHDATSSDQRQEQEQEQEQEQAPPSLPNRVLSSVTWSLSILFNWSSRSNATPKPHELVQTESATSLVSHHTPQMDVSNGVSSSKGDDLIGDRRPREDLLPVQIPSKAVSNMETSLPPRLLRRCNRLALARNDFILDQVQRANEMQKYLDKRRLTQESLEKLIEALVLRTEEGPQATTPLSFQSLKEQLLQDWEVLYQQSIVTMDIESAVSSKEYLLNKAEKRFMKSLKAFLMKLPDGETMVATLEEVRDESPTKNDSPKIPEMAQQYFDRCGDVVVLSEQVQDCEERHNGERETREHQRDQEIELDLPDDRFEAIFEAERKSLLDRLEAAERDRASMRVHCEENDIDVDALRFRQQNRQSDGSSSHSLVYLDSPQDPWNPPAFPDVAQKLTDIVSGINLNDTAHLVADGQFHEYQTEEGQYSIDKWLMDSSDKPVSTATTAFLDNNPRKFKLLLTRKQELRAKNMDKQRRYSDSALVVDWQE